MNQTLKYADGNRVDLDMGKASVIAEGRETPAWAISGAEDGGAPPVGVPSESCFDSVCGRASESHPR